jgi:spore coat protein CotH
MSTNKHLNYIAAILMSAVLIFVSVVLYNPRLLGIEAATGKLGYEKYFNEDSVMTVDILADKTEWNKMISNAQSEEYIQCDVVINGEEIDNVGIRAKGNSSLQQVAASGSERYSFKIEFDHYVNGQTFHGLDKLVLNNTQADASYMKEFMAYEIFESVGVKVPLHSYTQIMLNGENKGLYLAVESMEESYAYRVFGADFGQLYSPESLNMGQGANWKMTDEKVPEFENTKESNTSPDSALRMFENNSSNGADLVYTDDQITSYSAIFDNSVFEATEEDFKRVIEALKKLNQGSELEKYVDVDSTLRYFAAQTFIINFDSYYGSLQHNYYLYEKDGQLTMLPWDLNLAFAGFQSEDAETAVNYPIDTPLSGVSMEERPMLSKLLEVPEYSKLYHKYLKDIVIAYFDSGSYTAKIEKMDELIYPYVEEDTTAFYTMEEYEAAVPVLETFGLLRAKSVTGQLDKTIPSTEEGQASDNSALIDTGDLDLTVLGSQGGNGAWGKGTQDGNPQIPGGFGGRDTSQMPGGAQRQDRNRNNDPSHSANQNSNTADTAQAIETAATKTDFMGIGIAGAAAAAGLIFIFLYKSRKYH